MRVRLRGAFAVAALAAALAAAGCGGDDVVRIGLLADCTGLLAAFNDLEMASAELPLLERGARLAGKRPADGITSARIAGKRVALLVGCSEFGTYRVLIAEARRLVEKEHVDVLIGPGGDPDGLILREVARRHPSVAFVPTLSRAQETTLRDPAPNLFRFQPDGAQATGGLGRYAYHNLGWRTAAIVADDYSTAWPRVAGFVAEFCGLGGRVVSRVWTPAAAPLPRSLAAKIPREVDGVALITATPFTDWTKFVKAFARVHRNVARHLVLGPESLIQAPYRAAAARLAPGVVAGDPAPFDSRNPVWLRMQRDFAEHFPGLPPVASPAEFPVALAYYNAMEASLQALEKVGGDLSDRGQRFMTALAQVDLDSATGPIRLDRNHQAIASAYLSRVEPDAKGKPVLRTVRVVPNVEQTFNGYFTGATSPPSSTSPACRRAKPPPWAIGR